MPADLAYGHCFAVLGDAEQAAAAAAAALRRAGRSRSSVLAHARYQALLLPEPEPPSPAAAAPDDLTELARLLAMTRPARERALLDLRARLDRADFGRALGMPAADAAARADAVAEVWDRTLDPQLTARLGPGDCPDLAAVLADFGHATLADLADAGPAVAAHVESCDVCTDRRRAMVSVRTLFTQAPAGPTPEALWDVARRSRRMRPSPAPPPFEPRPRRRLLVVAASIAAVALVVGIAATAAAVARPGKSKAHRVAKLVQVPSAARLAIAVVNGGIEVTNHSKRALTWQAKADVPWLQVRPARGSIDPGGVLTLRPRVLASSPEGRLQAAVTVTSDDGSAAATLYEATVERAPDLAASAEGCAVTAMVEDGSGVGAVALHWSEPAGVHDTQLTAGPSGYAGHLPAGQPLRWWVTAADTRGNQARTPDAQLTC
jgi:hypothetical protein